MYRRTNLTVLVLLVLLVLVAVTIAHRCNHDAFVKQHPNTRPSATTRRSQNYPISKTKLARMTRQQQQAQFQPLRVTFIDDPSLKNLTLAQQQEVAQIFTDLKPLVANLLSVIRVTGNLKASDTTCGSYAVNQTFIDVGLANTDIGVILAYGGPDTSGTVRNSDCLVRKYVFCLQRKMLSCFLQLQDRCCNVVHVRSKR